ncbi:MAG: transcription-repair coupling factor, partial [Coriobacteriia bacterium]|nr:transcription-repair coupling factor [Coriobacteriia bacterium]
MLIDRLALSLSSATPVAHVVDLLARGDDATLATPGIVRPALVASLFALEPRPTLVVLPGEETAERFWRQAAAFLGRERVLHLPDRADLPWSDTAPDLAVVGARAHALYALDKGRPVIVVASARALMRAVPPHGSRAFDPLVLAAGAQLDLEQTAETLARMAYERVEAAELPGQFAVRGGILDVYPAGSTAPVRAELFGDDIETLRHYVPSTGQAIGDAGSVEVFPCRELAISNRGAEVVEKAMRDRALKNPSIAREVELIGQGVYFNGVERYLPLLYKKTGSVTDFLASDTLVVVAEPRSLFDDAVRRREELEAAAPAANVRSVLPDKGALEGLYITPAQLDFGERQRLTLVSLHRAGAGVDAQLAARRPEVSGGEERFIGGVRSLASTGYAVAVTVPDRRTRRRIEDSLAGAGVAFSERRDHVTADGEPQAIAPLPGDAVTLADTDVPAGFVVPDAKVAVISIDDVYPRSSIRRARRQIDPTRVTFGFAPGDYVVHATHGIALFREMVRQEVLGAERDYLLLEYAKGDKLYVPVEQIDRITKYVGAEG